MKNSNCTFAPLKNDIDYMSNKNLHPGVILSNLMIDSGLSQRELASKIDVSHSLLNNILNGSRNINLNIALSLEAYGFKKAEFWMTQQMKYSLNLAKSEPEYLKKSESIKIWDQIGQIVPINYLKKYTSISSHEDIERIFEIYKVENIEELKEKVENFSPSHFRKSSMFIEKKSNVVAWSLLAEHRAEAIDSEEIKPFSLDYESLIINELNECFYHNIDTVLKTKQILNKYGIKFLIQDKPPHTPVDGKSFVSGESPTIVLTLKYKRLDNFAFTIMHELGHVFKHLTQEYYKGDQFFINSSKTDIEELEADAYARNHLIDSNEWDEFLYSNISFADKVILRFSEKIKVHSGIIRGRLCFEKPEYYRKRTGLSSLNILPDYKNF
jgi:HTH-type transcriptional regulator/antitoxin HigA